MEHRALIGKTFSQDDAVVILSNFFADSQSDARAAVFASAMQSLKYFKDLVIIFRFETDTIITYHKMIIIFFQISFKYCIAFNDLPTDLDMRRDIRFRELE